MRAWREGHSDLSRVGWPQHPLASAETRPVGRAQAAVGSLSHISMLAPDSVFAYNCFPGEKEP